MDLYHYIGKGNHALQDGILSFAKNPNAQLGYYYRRTGGETTHAGIVKWMEKSFPGRSRSIRALIDPLQWTERSRHGIKELVIDACDLFKIDVSALDKDGLLEAVYVSPSILGKENEYPDDEPLYKLSGIDEIDFTPNDYSILDDEKGRRFAFLRYYLLVIKGGIIPPQYIKQVK